MPRLNPQTELIRNQQFMSALQQTNGNATAAAKLVGQIGSQGAKQPQKSAASMGSQRLKRLNISIVQACLDKGITPDKIAEKINLLLSDGNATVVDKGLVHALKIGIGGGYKVEPVSPITSSQVPEILKQPEVKKAVQDFEDVLKRHIRRPLQ